jgi:hypothetical protein
MSLGERCRPDFPILSRIVNGHPLVYLDSAASSQKPASVIEAIQRYYETSHANVHRSIHTRGEEATELYEAARDAVRAFLGARTREEIVFTRGTTESLNLVAQAVGRTLQPGDEIVVSELEHHSNLVPWQMVCRDRGTVLKAIPVLPEGYLDLEAYARLLSPRTRVVAVAHVSNVLGTINPVAQMAEQAHRAGALVCLDGAQAVPHLPVDVSAIGADFYAFSGHKMLGPTGIGVLHGRREILERLEPAWGGGEMIKEVWIDPAHRGRGRPARGGGVSRQARHGAGERARAGADRRHHGGPGGHPGRHPLRAPQSGDEGGGGRLQPGGHPSPRRGGAARPARHRGAGGPSLRAAAHEVPADRGHAAGQLLSLQHRPGRPAPRGGGRHPPRRALIARHGASP